MNIARTRGFPGAAIGSDHDLLMMTFHLRLKKISKPKHTRLKFDLKKLKNPNVLETFQAMLGGKFAPFTIMNNEDTDLDSMTTTFNTVVTETASEILGTLSEEEKTVSAEILDLCDRMRTEKETRSKTHKKLKERFLIGRIRTKRCKTLAVNSVSDFFEKETI